MSPFSDPHDSQRTWCCIPAFCGQYGEERDIGFCAWELDECSSTESLSTFGVDNMAALKRTVSSDLLHDLSKVQRLATTMPPTKNEHQETSDVKFSDPLVTSLKSRPRLEKDQVQSLFYSDVDIHRFERERSFVEEALSDEMHSLQSSSAESSCTDDIIIKGDQKIVACVKHKH